MSALAHAEQIVGLINAAGAHAYIAEDVARLPRRPAFYTEVHVMTGLTSEQERAGHFGGLTHYRVITRAVAQAQRNAERERETTATALLGATFTVGTTEAGPMFREVADDPIGPDDGWWSGVSSWTYTA